MTMTRISNRLWRLGAAFAVAASLLASSRLPGQAVPIPPAGQNGGRAAGDSGVPPVPERFRGDGATLPKPQELPPQSAPAFQSYDLNQLTELMLRLNPRLTQAAFGIDTAAGRAVQAGLYPNPVFSVLAEELGDRQGRAGIITAPQLSQEIVTGGKLGLSRAAAERGIDQAALSLLSLRYARLGAVRRAYYEVLALERRSDILDALLRLAEESIRASEKLAKAGQAARLDIVQLEVERERFRAEKESTLREIPSAFRRLAAAVGVSDLPQMPLAGALDVPPPLYDLEQAREFVSRAHPDVLSAKKGILRARLLLDRAKAEPIPDVTVLAAFRRQNETKSNDFNVGFSLPVPVWNRNQGNIAAAQAQLGEAIQQVGRVENELVERLAQSFGAYASARRRAELYRDSILPRARESYQLSLKGYQSGQFDYLRVLEAQRAYSQADLEAVRSLGEAWRAAAEVSGLLLEERWPCPQVRPVPAVK